MSRPPETDKQRKERMKKNEDLLKRWGMKKEVPATPKPGKLLTFPQHVARRLCKECQQGAMEEINFHGMEHIWKCYICAALIDISKE